MIDGPFSAPPKGAANVSVVTRLEERGRESVSTERKLRDKNIMTYETNFLVGGAKGKNYPRDTISIITKNFKKLK